MCVVRVTVLSLGLILLLGCGGGASHDGTYLLTRGIEDGKSYLDEKQSTMVLNKDGSATWSSTDLDSGQESTSSGTWKAVGDKMFFTIDDQEIEFSIEGEGKSLSFKGRLEGDDVEMTLEKQ